MWLYAPGHERRFVRIYLIYYPIYYPIYTTDASRFGGKRRASRLLTASTLLVFARWCTPCAVCVNCIYIMYT